MAMDVHEPIPSTKLSLASRNALRTGNFTCFADLLVTPINEVARKCKISAQDAQAIYDTLLRACKPLSLPSLDTLSLPVDEVFSTGDLFLDQALGGGIRTGMVWEIVGESAAGKSQLALQFSLFVQNPPNLNGITGATCYLTTSAQLPTTRLTQILQHNKTLSKQSCTLDNVHTIRISTIQMLTNILSNLLPNFIYQNLSSSHPVKLVIIDALTELFHSADKMSNVTLFERSKELNRLSATLHALATTHNIAIVVVNEVVDKFERGSGGTRSAYGDLVYSHQSRFFGTNNSVPGESTKEASLGLVWANAINARIMLTRTGRRRYLSEHGSQPKKARVESQAPLSTLQGSPQTEEQATVIRRLSVIFSSVSPPTSMDYIVTIKGLTILPDDSQQDTGQMDYRFAEEPRPSESQLRTEASAVPKVPPEHTPASSERPQFQEHQEEGDEFDRLLNDSEDALLFDAYDDFETQLTQTT